MGLLGDVGKGLLKVGLAPVTGGLSLIPGADNLLSEDTLDKVPLIGAFTRSDEEDALVAKQKELAEVAKKRLAQQQQAGMNALGQRMLAFNPQNQLMAQMFGPEAAFSPEQFAQMTQNPMGPPQGRPETVNYQGGDPKMLAEIDQLMKQRREYEAQEQRRKDMLMNGIQQPGPGPQALKPTRVAPGRGY